jgi:hypothetical protein
MQPTDKERRCGSETRKPRTIEAARQQTADRQLIHRNDPSAERTTAQVPSHTTSQWIDPHNHRWGKEQERAGEKHKCFRFRHFHRSSAYTTRSRQGTGSGRDHTRSSRDSTESVSAGSRRAPARNERKASDERWHTCVRCKRAPAARTPPHEEAAGNTARLTPNTPHAPPTTQAPASPHSTERIESSLSGQAGRRVDNTQRTRNGRADTLSLPRTTPNSSLASSHRNLFPMFTSATPQSNPNPTQKTKKRSTKTQLNPPLISLRRSSPDPRAMPHTNTHKARF